MVEKSWVFAVAALVLCACAGSSGEGPKPEDAVRSEDAAVIGDADVADGNVRDADAPDAQTAPACDVLPPVTCDEPSPRYADVAPIFSTRCVACHNGAGEEWPLTSYQHVADWFGEIRAQMIACTMPPLDSGLTMPIEERQLILQWIRCGFPR